jgi:hypothetical protein
MWKSLSLKDKRLSETLKGHELSPELNMYKLAKDMGMRVYDTQPTFVYHASGASNTWDQKKRPDIGRWTHEWPLASSIQTACSPVRAKAIVMACALWNCSCQRLSEMTGVNHHLHFWGTTSNVQRKWWLTNVCQTGPAESAV